MSLYAPVRWLYTYIYLYDAVPRPPGPPPPEWVGSIQERGLEGVCKQIDLKWMPEGGTLCVLVLSLLAYSAKMTYFHDIHAIHDIQDVCNIYYLHYIHDIDYEQYIRCRQYIPTYYSRHVLKDLHTPACM